MTSSSRDDSVRTNGEVYILFIIRLYVFSFRLAARYVRLCAQSLGGRKAALEMCCGRWRVQNASVVDGEENVNRFGFANRRRPAEII